MGRTVAIGIQDFEKIRRGNYFYVDKTDFIREWWESGDDVTLIARPRRFGKTLNISMLEYFFSINYKDRGDLFEGLSIWNDEKYRQLQGTYPVISLSFASVKERNFEMTRKKICQLIANLYDKNSFLLSSGVMKENDIRYFKRVSEEMDDSDASLSLHQLADYLSRYYGKKVIILLDEYDTPMQEAYVNGFRNEIVAFTRNLFNSTFKTNPYLERAIMMGITRVSKESIFSDLNNLKVITTTSDEYASAFGFTEKEVFAALEECGYSDQKKCVKQWYDGFVLGLMVDLADRYIITSNRESGFGRYDIMIEPKQKEAEAFIIEFKVFNPRREASLEETVQNALAQIEEKKYAAELIKRGIAEEHINKYGFAFKGKEVLIG